MSEIKLVDSEWIAALLQMNPRHVRDRITKQTGFPKAYRVGHSLRWDAEDIREWLSKRRVSPQARQSAGNKGKENAKL